MWTRQQESQRVAERLAELQNAEGETATVPIDASE